MYKLLLFLHKTEKDEVLQHFNDYTRDLLADVTGKEISLGKVESNLLLDQKYSSFCELTFDSKDEWDRLMSSKEGRILNKDLMDFHQHLTIIFVDYKN